MPTGHLLQRFHDAVARLLVEGHEGTGLRESRAGRSRVGTAVLARKEAAGKRAPAGTRFAEAGSFVPFDKEMGYRVVDALKEVAARHDASPARTALSWVLGRPAVSSVIVAARKAEQLEDNIGAVDLRLSDEEVRLLDAVSDPGIPYPKWMVLQLDTAEDPRSKALYPERYVGGGPWKDRRGTRWSG